MILCRSMGENERGAEGRGGGSPTLGHTAVGVID